MNRVLYPICAMALLVGACGCGTAMNLNGERRAYGGIQTDVECSKFILSDKFLGGSTWREKNIEQKVAVGLIVGSCLAVDLPLCAVADTLTLPLTILAAREHSQSLSESRFDPAPN